MNSIIHSLILNLFPILIGVAAYGLIGRRVRSVLGQIVICGSATFCALVLEYLGFLVVGGLMTGNWPEEYSVIGLGYGFLWFLIPGIIVSAPQVVMGYGLTWLLHAWRLRARSTHRDDQVPPDELNLMDQSHESLRGIPTTGKPPLRT